MEQASQRGYDNAHEKRVYECVLSSIAFKLHQEQSIN